MEIIETSRLQLRRWQECDAEALYQLASDPEIGPRAGWPPHQSVEESKSIIKKIFDNDRTWAIVLKETDTLIGCMGYYPNGISNIEIGRNDAEVGYWIGRSYWNKGYCTEALVAMIDYCFNVKKFEKLWADYFVDNPASGRVMKKCGFADTGMMNYCSKLFHAEDSPIHIMRLEKP